MPTRTPREIPAGMRRVCQRFERWRRGHRARLPIPEDLWASAAEVARKHGVFRTAKVLRLDYGKLKRIAKTAAPGVPAAVPPPAFLELVASPAVAVSECLIELEGPRGKMRIQWKGTTAPDLTGLSRSLWESA